MFWQVEKVDTTKLLITEDGTYNLAACKLCANTSSGKDTIDECTLVTSQSNSNDLDIEKFQNFLASKGKILSQTSLTALVQKRNKLVKPVITCFMRRMFPSVLLTYSPVITCFMCD